MHNAPLGSISLVLGRTNDLSFASMHFTMGELLNLIMWDWAWQLVIPIPSCVGIVYIFLPVPGCGIYFFKARLCSHFQQKSLQFYEKNWFSICFVQQSQQKILPHQLFPQRGQNFISYRGYHTSSCSGYVCLILFHRKVDGFPRKILFSGV